MSEAETGDLTAVVQEPPASPDIDYERVSRILFPYAAAAEDRARAGMRFVHYTAAQSALDILKSGCMWMRNATCMNDYNEMRHGMHCLVAAFATDAGKTFNNVLNDCYRGLAKELDAKFKAAAPHLLEHTYVACVTEHGDDEELYGRLSMWRAYGTTTGVALVLNSGPFVRASSAFPAWATPVAYINADGVRGQVQTIADNIAANRSFLAEIPRSDLLDMLFRVLVFAVVSSKHEGFKEEREWMIVHLPMIWPAPVDRLPLDQVSLGGVPQPIFKIPFRDYAGDGFYGATIPDLIERVIVGPSQYPVAIRTALAQTLGSAGVPNSLDRVHCSDISLRTS